MITEWRSPDFQSTLGLVSLLGIIVTVGVLARRRVPWAAVLPAAGFLGLGLIALRNLAPFSFVAAAALASALRPDATAPGGAGSGPATSTWTRADRMVTALAVVVAVVVVVHAASLPALDVSAYPRNVIGAGERDGVLAPGRRVAVQDVVGCYLILRRGRSAGVFIDDRYDMYPVSVSRDYTTLLRGQPGAYDVLARDGIDTVLWDRRQPLVPLLLTSGWKEQVGDKTWVVLTRPGTWPGGG